MPPALRILAVDTASRSCSVAVRIGERLAAETAVVSGRTHSVHLQRMIRETLALAELDLAQLDGLAVAVGPGSFTGLRIGISTVQGLAVAVGKPCAGVSSLEALAWAGRPWPHAICALMDARKGEVYAGIYRDCRGRLEPTAPERVAPIEDVLKPMGAPHLFVGDGAECHRERIRAVLGELAVFAPPERGFARAGAVARLAQPLLAAGQGVDPARLLPRYLRQSDAELHLLRPAATRLRGAPADPRGCVDKS
jgi:tRNA threonylcarbamoyladenosine biosynthesis protein TsaB